MKHLSISIVLCLLGTGTIMSATPQIINYQGRLTDPNNDPVETSVHSMLFKFYDNSIGGIELWSSDGFRPVQITDGLFVHLLGSSNPIPDSLFKYDSLFLGITVDFDSEMAPRVALTSVNFAFKSMIAEHAYKSDSTHYSEISSHAILADSAVTAGYSVTSGHSDTSFYSHYSDTSNHTIYADTAYVIATTSNFRKIDSNYSSTSTSSTVWVTLAEFSIPAFEVTSFIQVISHVQGSSMLHAVSGSASGLLRITVDDIEEKVCIPITSSYVKSGNTAQTFMVHYYEPTTNQLENGFNVKIQGRVSQSGSASGSARHISTEIWGQ